MVDLLFVNDGLPTDTHCSSPTFLRRHISVSRRSISCQASALRTACLVFSVWWVGRVGQASLPLAHVPVQALRQALEPIVNQVMATDGGHRVAGCGDLDAAEGESQHQGPRGATPTAVDCNGQMVTSLQTGSPVSSCRQTTPRRCSWPRGTAWSDWGWRGGRSTSGQTEKRRYAAFTPLVVETQLGFQILRSQEIIFL